MQYREKKKEKQDIQFDITVSRKTRRSLILDSRLVYRIPTYSYAPSAVGSKRGAGFAELWLRCHHGADEWRGRCLCGYVINNIWHGRVEPRWDGGGDTRCGLITAWNLTEK